MIAYLITVYLVVVVVIGCYFGFNSVAYIALSLTVWLVCLLLVYDVWLVLFTLWLLLVLLFGMPLL